MFLFFKYCDDSGICLTGDVQNKVYTVETSHSLSGDLPIINSHTIEHQRQSDMKIIIFIYFIQFLHLLMDGEAKLRCTRHNNVVLLSYYKIMITHFGLTSAHD